MKKNIWMKIITIGLLCLSLVACSSESTNEPNTTKAEPSQEPAKQEQPKQEQPAEQQKEATQKQEANIEIATWKFTGLVDTHSAEFMVDNEPLVAEYPEDLRNALESLEENQELEVHYKKDENGRFVLVKIEKVQ